MALVVLADVYIYIYIADGFARLSNILIYTSRAFHITIFKTPISITAAKSFTPSAMHSVYITYRNYIETVLKTYIQQSREVDAPRIPIWRSKSRRETLWARASCVSYNACWQDCAQRERVVWAARARDKPGSAGYRGMCISKWERERAQREGQS